MAPKSFLITPLGWTFWLPMIVTGLVVGGMLLLIYWPAAILLAVVLLACLAFFRDLPRTIPAAPGLMVSPADGRITEITRLDHHPILTGPALRIGIFLSVLDVHVNRSPCDGYVLKTLFEPGMFLDARHPQSGLRNQSNTLVLISAPPTSPGHEPIAVVRQIVGAIARRIICPVTSGASLHRGQLFGMIAFGSRTELIVPNPDRWEVAVNIGDHVKAGSHVLLRLRS
ncbi:MAG: phosphatidylserine decarboxylase [Phycisphaerae bacterium]